MNAIDSLIPRKTSAFLSTVSLIVIAAAALRSTPAPAQEYCSEVLQKTNITKVDTILKTFAYLQLIENDQELADARDQGGSIGLILDGLPVGASFANHQFQNWRSKFLEKTNIQMTDNEAHALHASFIPEAQVKAWSQCMSERMHSGGLALGVAALVPLPSGMERVEVKFHYEPSDDITETPLKFSIAPEGKADGGKIDDPARFPKWRGVSKNRKDALVSYTRDPGSILIVHVLQTFENGLFAGKSSQLLTLTVPAEPTFSNHWSPDLAKKYKGVAADGGKNPFEIPSEVQFKPGSHVLVAFQSMNVKSDNPNVNWIQIRATIHQREGLDPYAETTHTVLDHKSGGVAQEPFTIQHEIVVPWDGIVRTDIFTERAEDDAGIQHSLSATSGLYTIDALPEGQ